MRSLLTIIDYFHYTEYFFIFSYDFLNSNVRVKSLRYLIFLVLYDSIIIWIGKEHASKELANSHVLHSPRSHDYFLAGMRFIVIDMPIPRNDYWRFKEI